MARLDHRHVIAELTVRPLTAADQPELWAELERQESRVRDHFLAMGLLLNRRIESGIAWLSQAPDDPESDFAPIRKVLRTTPLGFDASVLVALLRERLLDHNADPDTRDELTLTDGELVRLLSPFLPASPNESRTENRVRAAANRLAESGILKRKPGALGGEVWVVRPLIEAKLTGDEAHALRERLAAVPAAERQAATTSETLPDEI